MKHTFFDTKKFNRMAGAYRKAGYHGPFPKVSGYEEFAARYPIISKSDLRSTARRLSDEGRFKECYIMTTSGSTSQPMVFANRLWHKITPKSYPYQLCVHLARRVFDRKDVVANLFSAGGFGFLYEGACRYLEPIGVTILPIGRYDALGDQAAALQIMRQTNVNTLLGTPSSILQIANASIAGDAVLQIRKVVYTGEPFHEAKAAFIRKLWPQARFYSLYGATEFGFLGTNVPGDPQGQHVVLTDFFFVEVNEDNELIVTDLKSPLLPVIRYRVGDKADLHVDETAQVSRLSLRGRSDESFKFMGNLVAFAMLEETVQQVTGTRTDFQVQLRTDVRGCDCISIIFGKHAAIDPGLQVQIRDAIAGRPEIEEGIQKGVGKVDVVIQTQPIISARSKSVRILDRRASGAQANITAA